MERYTGELVKSVEVSLWTPYQTFPDKNLELYDLKDQNINSLDAGTSRTEVRNGAWKRGLSGKLT